MSCDANMIICVNFVFHMYSIFVHLQGLFFNLFIYLFICLFIYLFINLFIYFYRFPMPKVDGKEVERSIPGAKYVFR